MLRKLLYSKVIQVDQEFESSEMGLKKWQICWKIYKNNSVSFPNLKTTQLTSYRKQKACSLERLSQRSCRPKEWYSWGTLLTENTKIRKLSETCIKNGKPLDYLCRLPKHWWLGLFTLLSPRQGNGRLLSGKNDEIQQKEILRLKSHISTWQLLNMIWGSLNIWKKPPKWKRSK